MKKTILLSAIGLLFLCCNKAKAPKCNEAENIQRLIKALNEKRPTLTISNPVMGTQNFNSEIDSSNTKIENVLQKTADDALQLCGCDATVSIESEKFYFINDISYSMQVDENKEYIIKIDEPDSFTMVHK